MIKSKIPEVGERFGKWLVLEDVPILIKKGHWGVLCKCECGTERLVRIWSLRSGRSNGCECVAINKNKSRVIAIGNLSKTLYSRFQKAAYKRNIEWNVSMEYLWDIFTEQSGKCALSKIEIVLNTSLCRKKGMSNITASLDRIDSSKGYIKGNVQWVHKDVNKMKQDLNETYFVEMCKKIANV